MIFPRRLGLLLLALTFTFSSSAPFAESKKSNSYGAGYIFWFGYHCEIFGKSREMSALWKDTPDYDRGHDDNDYDSWDVVSGVDCQKIERVMDQLIAIGGKPRGAKEARGNSAGTSSSNGTGKATLELTWKERLAMITEWRRQGHIGEDEFQRKKAWILSKIQ
jgi:hypothetical protein